MELTPFGGILNISYDGTHFHGWSAANDDPTKSKEPITFSNEQQSSKIKRSRRNRRGLRLIKNQVRSVEGVIQSQLAKLYGNVPISNIHLTGCSRTDKGVHSRSLIASFYCQDPSLNNTSILPSLENVQPLPCNQDLGKIMFCLNRMLPPDVRVQGIQPYYDANFHPTADALEKTYQYTFSIGTLHDPMRHRHVWHLDGVGNSNRPWNELEAQRVCAIFKGIHDFSGFQGAPRGSDRQNTKIRNPICHMTKIELQKEFGMDDFVIPIGGEHRCHTYTIEITGNRFLYKMVRFMVGSIMAVGMEKIKIQDIERALATGIWEEEARKYVQCAPPHGLMLKHVKYEEHCLNDWITYNS